jgi:hypothetical protein
MHWTTSLTRPAAALAPLRAPQPSGRPAARARAAPARALFGWGESAEDKERRAEQWAAQQEVLKRRKTGAWRKVRKGRLDPAGSGRGERDAKSAAFPPTLALSPFMCDPACATTHSHAHSLSSQDMDERRGKVSRYNRDPTYKKAVDEERRARVKAEKEAAEAERGPARFIIPLPVNPIGMPEYDNGERFDLRLPYVDNGWVDEDEEPFGKLARFLTGKGGKKEEEGKGTKKGRK